MMRSKMVESLARVKNIWYFYKKGEQSRELKFNQMNIYEGYNAFIRDG